MGNLWNYKVIQEDNEKFIREEGDRVKKTAEEFRTKFGNRPKVDFTKVHEIYYIGNIYHNGDGPKCMFVKFNYLAIKDGDTFIAVYTEHTKRNFFGTENEFTRVVVIPFSEYGSSFFIHVELAQEKALKMIESGGDRNPKLRPKWILCDKEYEGFDPNRRF